MFAVDCPVIGKRVLVFLSQVRDIANHDRGIDVYFKCRCGGAGVWRSGRRAVGEALVAHVGPEGGELQDGEQG